MCRRELGFHAFERSFPADFPCKPSLSTLISLRRDFDFGRPRIKIPFKYTLDTERLKATPTSNFSTIKIFSPGEVISSNSTISPLYLLSPEKEPLLLSYIRLLWRKLLCSRFDRMLNARLLRRSVARVGCWQESSVGLVTH